MPDRDWDKELAKIDKQLASLSDDALLGPTPVQIPGKAAPAPAGKSAPAAKPGKLAKPATPVKAASTGEPYTTRAWTVYLRLLIAVALGVGIFMWPYPARCGAGLAGYLGADIAVIAGGLWSSIWTWRHRAGRSHTLSLLIVLWGLVLGAVQVLPRIGYGKPDAEHPATWTCQQTSAPTTPQTTPPQTTTPQTTPQANPPSGSQPTSPTPPKGAR